MVAVVAGGIALAVVVWVVLEAPLYVLLRRGAGREQAKLFLWIQGICLGVGLPLGIVLAVVLWDRPQRAVAVVAALVVLTALAVLGCVVYQARRQPSLIREAGEVLLPLRPSQALRRMLPFFGGTTALSITLTLFAVVAKGRNPLLLLCLILFVAACSVFLFLNSNTGPRLCEHGILVYAGLIRWSRILDYSWEGADGLRLTVHVKRRFFPRVPSVFTIGAEQHDAVDWVVREHVPLTATSGGLQHGAGAPEI